MGKRHRRIRAQSATGQVAGAATEQSPGSEPIVQTGPPTIRSPRSPRPGQPTIGSEPDASFRKDFHAPSSESVDRGREQARNPSAEREPAHGRARHRRAAGTQVVVTADPSPYRHAGPVAALIGLSKLRPSSVERLIEIATGRLSVPPKLPSSRVLCLESYVTDGSDPVEGSARTLITPARNDPSRCGRGRSGR